MNWTGNIRRVVGPTALRAPDVSGGSPRRRSPAADHGSRPGAGDQPGLCAKSCRSRTGAGAGRLVPLKTGIRRLDFSFRSALRISLRYALAVDPASFEQRPSCATRSRSPSVPGRRRLQEDDKRQLQRLIDQAEKLRGTPVQIPHFEHREAPPGHLFQGGEHVRARLARVCSGTPTRAERFERLPADGVDSPRHTWCGRLPPGISMPATASSWSMPACCRTVSNWTAFAATSAPCPLRPAERSLAR